MPTRFRGAAHLLLIDAVVTTPISPGGNPAADQRRAEQPTRLLPRHPLVQRAPGAQGEHDSEGRHDARADRPVEEAARPDRQRDGVAVGA